MMRKRSERARQNKTCQSYWFPRLPADIPVPKTALIEFPLDLQMLCLRAFEDEELGDDEKEQLERGISKVREMTDLFGYPVFVKTGLFSDKHSWSCYVPDREALGRAIVQIVYSWACVGGMEESEFIVVREMIPTRPYMLFAGRMPVTRERRYFAEDGEVKWHQPYWPREAFPEWAKTDLLGHESIEVALGHLNDETEEEVQRLSALARSISTAIPGAWSMDFLQDIHGNWWLIDMAEAHKSYINKNYEEGKRWLGSAKG
jgi:hypothetical protein